MFKLCTSAIEQYNSKKNTDTDNINISYLINYKPHCMLFNNNNNSIGKHICGGKYIIISKNPKKNELNNFYIICTKCNKCYLDKCFPILCCNCNSLYYSEIIDHKIKKENCYLATWFKYHCKNINNEKMTCIKCGQEFCIKNNKLICKKCKFEIEPINIIWTCLICNTDFNSDNRNSWGNPVNIALWAIPWWTSREILTDASGNFIGYGDEQIYMDDYGGYNHHYRWAWTPRRNNYVRLNGNIYEELSPIKGLTIRFAQGLEGYDYRYTGTNLVDPHGLRTTGGSTEEFERYYRLTTTNTAEYRFQFAEKNNMTFLVGQEAIINNTTSFSAGSTGQTDVRLFAVNQGTTYSAPTWSYSQYKYNSLFTRLSYDYDSKYYLDASFRRDGSSLFGKDNRYANFWSVGGMWNIKTSLGNS